MSTPINIDLISQLLKEDSKKAAADAPRKSSTGTSTNKSGPWPRPMQWGFLRWGDEAQPCLWRNCRSPTLIRIFGVPKCGIHALYELNKLLTQFHPDYLEVAHFKDDCTCIAGKQSLMNIHTHDCALFERMTAFNTKEQSDSSKSDSDAN